MVDLRKLLPLMVMTWLQPVRRPLTPNLCLIHIVTRTMNTSEIDSLKMLTVAHFPPWSRNPRKDPTPNRPPTAHLTHNLQF